MIEFNDLLRKVGLEPERVMVMRHRPDVKAFREALPTLAAERPELYNAYQSQHGGPVEKSLLRATHLASFIGHEPGHAVFVGLYAMVDAKQITTEAFWAIPENQILGTLGTRGPAAGQEPLWFDLRICPELAELKGRLIVTWPGIERSWWRWAARNVFHVHSILEESRLVRRMPPWDELVVTWAELQLLPKSWLAALSQWRGVYYIFDTGSGKGYVGSASGTDNLLGRWNGYAASGHGDNRLLRKHDSIGFVFSILELVAPSLESSAVVAIENHWKQRLHTRTPFGLNAN